MLYNCAFMKRAIGNHLKIYSNTWYLLGNTIIDDIPLFRNTCHAIRNKSTHEEDS